MHDAVELPSSSRGKHKLAIGNFFLGQIDRGEVALAIWRQEAVGEQVLAAVLEVVAFLIKSGYSLVGWAHPVNLIANILRIAPGKCSFSFLLIQSPRH